MAGCAAPVRAKRSGCDRSSRPYSAPIRSMFSAAKNLSAPIQFGAERREAPVEPARHPDILRALSWEHENDGRRRDRRLAQAHARRGRPGQQGLSVGMIPAGDGESVREVPPPALQGESDVGERRVRVRRQMVRQAAPASALARTVTARRAPATPAASTRSPRRARAALPIPRGRSCRPHPGK